MAFGGSGLGGGRRDALCVGKWLYREWYKPVKFVLAPDAMPCLAPCCVAHHTHIYRGLAADAELPSGIGLFGHLYPC